MTFVEGNKYTLKTSIFDIVKLECTFVEDNTIWFILPLVTVNADVKDVVHYKLNRKTNKLYKLNVAFSSWDTIENTLCEENSTEAKKPSVYFYDTI